MNRFLYWSSGAALMLSVNMGLLWLLGYTIGNLALVVFALPLVTAATTMILIFILVAIVDAVASLLVFSTKTIGRNSKSLRLLTRRFLIAIDNPPDWFFIVLAVTATTAAIRFLAATEANALASPGLLADLIVSSVFWLLLMKIEAMSAQ